LTTAGGATYDRQSETRADILGGQAEEIALPGVRRAASSLPAIQQAVGNTGMGRLLTSPAATGRSSG
jgi:hypothetical protein